MKRLVKYIDNKEGNVKINPILKSTFLFLIFFIAPKKAVRPTINNEYVVAKIGSIVKI